MNNPISRLLKKWFGVLPAGTCFGSRKQRAKKQPHSFRPQLLQLEDRIVPATLTVTTLANSDTGGLLSLRGAIFDSINLTNTDSPVSGTGNDTLVFSASLFTSGPGTISLSTVGDIPLAHRPWGSTATISRSTHSGADKGRQQRVDDHTDCGRFCCSSEVASGSSCSRSRT